MWDGGSSLVAGHPYESVPTQVGKKALAAESEDNTFYSFTNFYTIVDNMTVTAHQGKPVCSCSVPVCCRALLYLSIVLFQRFQTKSSSNPCLPEINDKTLADDDLSFASEGGALPTKLSPTAKRSQQTSSSTISLSSFLRHEAECHWLTPRASASAEEMAQSLNEAVTAVARESREPVYPQDSLKPAQPVTVILAKQRRRHLHKQLPPPVTAGSETSHFLSLIQQPHANLSAACVSTNRPDPSDKAMGCNVETPQHLSPACSVTPFAVASRTQVVTRFLSAYSP